jgi:hypothetical protein
MEISYGRRARTAGGTSWVPGVVSRAKMVHVAYCVCDSDIPHRSSTIRYISPLDVARRPPSSTIDRLQSSFRFKSHLISFALSSPTACRSFSQVMKSWSR